MPTCARAFRHFFLVLFDAVQSIGCTFPACSSHNPFLSISIDRKHDVNRFKEGFTIKRGMGNGVALDAHDNTAPHTAHILQGKPETNTPFVRF